MRAAAAGHFAPRDFGGALLPTLVAEGAHLGAFQGPMVHWEEARRLTLRESARAAGLDDHWVFVGTQAEALAIVGHCVPRHLAAALGLAIRAALEEEDLGE